MLKISQISQVELQQSNVTRTKPRYFYPYSLDLFVVNLNIEISEITCTSKGHVTCFTGVTLPPVLRVSQQQSTCQHKVIFYQGIQEHAISKYNALDCELR